MSSGALAHRPGLLRKASQKYWYFGGLLTIRAGSSSTNSIFFFIMLVAAAEVTVGLAILVHLKRNTDGVDINTLNRLKW